MSLGNSDSIVNLVQKTIIPLNRVVPKPAILDKPCFNIITKIDVSLPQKVDIEPTKEVYDPTQRQEKKAHRMLIIRRKKMNKHKYKKRCRKRRVQWRQREFERALKREAAFRQEIHAMLKEAKNFSAEEYVAQKLENYRREVLPNRIHGCRMPPFAVKDYLERRDKRRQEKANKIERRKKFIQERGSILVDQIK